MTARKIVLLGAVAVLTLAGTRSGMAEGSFDSVSRNATTHTDKAAAAVSSDANITDAGVFSLAASASQADPSIDGGAARALATATATKSFTLAPGDYRAEIVVHEVYGAATRDGLGNAGASFSVNLNCAACTWDGTRNFNIMSAITPGPSQMENDGRAAAVPFTVNEATTVTLIVDISAGATTGNGVMTGQIPLEPVTNMPAAEYGVHGGSGDISLRGVLDPIVVTLVPASA